MKVLIYIICFFFMAFIQSSVKDAGVILGAVPTTILYLFALGAAKILCGLWEKRKSKRVDSGDETVNFEDSANNRRSAIHPRKVKSKTIIILVLLVLLVGLLVLNYLKYNEKGIESTEHHGQSKNLGEETSENSNQDSSVSIENKSSEIENKRYEKGVLSSTSYKNQYFDLMLFLPDWWVMYTEEEVEEEFGAYSEHSGGVEMLAYNALSSEIVWLLVEKTDLKDVSLEAYVEFSLDSLPESFKIVSRNEKRTIGGYEYVVAKSCVYGETSEGNFNMDMYFRGTGNVFLTLVTVYYGDDPTSAESVLKAFQKCDQKIFTSELKDNEYIIADIPGKITVSENYNVYSLENEITEEMCAAQKTTYEQAISYLEQIKSLGGIEMVILPASEPISGAGFEIQVKVKTKDYGFYNLKDASDEDFEQFAEWLMQEFSSLGCVGYKKHETSSAKFVVFDCEIMEYQKRYASIINGKMVYIIALSPSGRISEEQNSELINIVNSIQY